MKTFLCRRPGIIIAAALILSLLLPAAAFADSNIEISEYMLDIMPRSVFPDSKNPPREIPAYFDGLLTCRSFLYKDSLWFPIGDLCRYFGGDVRIFWYPETESICVTGSGIEISMLIGSQYITVNNRFIFSPGDFLMIGTDVCFPADIISRMFQLGISLSEDGCRTLVDSSCAKMLQGSHSYYEDTYGDDFTLLTHLINAEAGHSPLTGRIGVGNVVFNRVADERFPDNIYDVIFDQNNAVQFAPTVNGTLYETPNEVSRVAAGLVFEGVNTVGDALYFDEAWADLSWLHPTHFVCKIGGHSFYN